MKMTIKPTNMHGSICIGPGHVHVNMVQPRKKTGTGQLHVFPSINSSGYEFASGNQWELFI